MSQSTYERALRAVERLSLEEQTELLRDLSQRLQSERLRFRNRRDLRDLKEFFGAVPPVERGMDTQEWVSRLRSEWDERLAER